MALSLRPGEGDSYLWSASSTMQLEIHRVSSEQASSAYSFVNEYYEAVSVVVRETSAEFLAQYFTPSTGIWLASINDEIAGCIALRSMDQSSCAEIKRMYVRPAHRGFGVAQKLLAAAEQFATEHGYQQIYLDTAAGMLAAARLYQRNGYLLCDRYNANPQAALFMRKQLL